MTLYLYKEKEYCIGYWVVKKILVTQGVWLIPQNKHDMRKIIQTKYFNLFIRMTTCINFYNSYIVLRVKQIDQHNIYLSFHRHRLWKATFFFNILCITVKTHQVRMWLRSTLTKLDKLIFVVGNTYFSLFRKVSTNRCFLFSLLAV